MIPAMRRPAGVPALVPLGLLFVSASACEPDTGPSSGVEVRDSAGIEVVENLTPPDRIPVFAFLDRSPRAEIGALVDDPDQEFGFIRDAAYLDPDRIVVADEQHKERNARTPDGNDRRRTRRRLGAWDAG
jgi:hypothetical protein